MKKVLSFLSVLVLTIMVSVFSVACGDKYKNMYLEVQYSEWIVENGEGYYGDWITIDVDPNSEDYGLSFMLQNMKKDDSGNYKLRMRVLVKGTKKEVDYITVFCPEVELSARTVKSGQEFYMTFSNTASPRFSAVPSIKSDSARVDFPIVIYSELKNVEANSDYFPAVTKGGSLTLNDLTDLMIYNGVGGMSTNQKGVKYSVEGGNLTVAEYENGYTYTIGDSKTSNYFVLDTRNDINTITVGSAFDLNSVTIKATSIYKDYLLGLFEPTGNKTVSDREKELITSFDVKVVDNLSSGNIGVYYYEGQGTTNVTEVTLYKNSEKYSGTTMSLYMPFGEGVVDYKFDDNYNFNKELADGSDKEVYYDVKIEIYDADKNEYVDIAKYNNAHKGIHITPYADKSDYCTKVFGINLYEFSGITENRIRFIIGFNNLKFTGKNYSMEKSVLTYDLLIKRGDLPNALYINGVSYGDGNSLDGIIYDNYTNNVKGYELNINAVREIQQQTEIKFTITSDGSTYAAGYKPVTARYFNGTLVDGDVLRDLTNKVFLKFEGAGAYPDNVYVKFEVLASPLNFDGKVVDTKEYITVNLTLRVSGSVVGVKDDTNTLFGTTDIKYVEANKGSVVKILPQSSGSLNVANETIAIGSEKSLIKLSGDGINWVDTIRFNELSDNNLYIKADKNVSSKLIVSVDNGDVYQSTNIKFVEVAQGEPILTFDNTYIYDAYQVNNGVACQEDYYNGKNGYYLAMQLSTSTDFVIAYNNSTAGIFNTHAQTLKYTNVTSMGKSISTYAVDCVTITNFSNGNSFNVEATNYNVTTVIEVSYNYYSKATGNLIVIEEDVVYIELSVYVPVTTMSLETFNGIGEVVNNEIYYVNEKLIDRASVSIDVSVNNSATRNIWFSNADLNEKLNNSDKNKTGYIFNISVNHDSFDGLETSARIINSGKYYLNLNSTLYMMELTKNILNDDEANKEIKVNFTVEMLGYARQFSKIIKVIRHTKVENIEISGTYDYNMYLSLLSEEDKIASFGAKVSNMGATYPNLEYEIYEFSEANKNGHYLGTKLPNSNGKLKVLINSANNTVTLQAVATEGGMFVVRIISPDSFDDVKREYTLSKYIVVTVSDGSEYSPYYLNRPEDVYKIKNNADKHFVLASNINLSRLEGPLAENFSGSINGVIRVYNAETKTNVYSQYKFTDLTITNDFKVQDSTANNYNYGLFGKNSGTISNLVIERVRFANVSDGFITNFVLEGGEGNKNANIGALVGVNIGTIINSSVSILTSNINLDNIQYKNVNIGGLVGYNSTEVVSTVEKIGKILYYDQDNNADKKYSNIIQSAVYYGNVTVSVSSIKESAVNIGGLIGNNAEKSSFVANYFEYEESLFKEYLTASVYLKLNIDSTITNNYSGNVGGIVGANYGEISQVCVTGEVTVSGNKISAGGIAGLNANELINSASYTTKVSGLPYYNADKGEYQSKIEEQYVGGAVGQLSGTLTSVDVVYVKLNGTGFDTPANASINGSCVVGGLVGYANNGTITNGNVQSFVDNAIIKGLFNANSDDSEKLLGGLIGKNVDTVSSVCFVSADILIEEKDRTGSTNYDKPEVNTLTDGTIENSYFVGNVQIYEAGKLQLLNGTGLLTEFKANYSNKLYSLVFGYVHKVEISTDPLVEKEFKYAQLFCGTGVVGYYYPAGECWISNTDVFNDGVVSSGEIADVPSLGLVSEHWSNDTSYKEYNYGLPVLKYNDKHTMIALPDELYANVSKNEFDDGKNDPTISINENGIFVNDGFGNNSAIVFLSDKTYNLVSENGKVGLVDKTVDPSIASGQYYVTIISGADYCMLSGNSIKFTKLGRIEIELVSLFNPDAKDRVVIYVESPVDGFNVLNSGKVVESLSTQTNVNRVLEFMALTGSAESGIDVSNLFLSFGLFDEGVPLDADIAEVNPLGNIKGTEYYTFDDLQLKIGNIEANKKTVNLVTKMYLNLANYIFDYVDVNGDIIARTYEEIFGVDKILISEKEIEINIYQSASSLIIDTAEQNIPTSKDSFIEFDIVSSYIENDIDNEAITSWDIDGRYLYANVDFTESFKILIASNHEEDWLKTYNINSLWDLFTYSCYYSTIEGIGYSYVFYFELKDEYKSIVRDEVFEFKFIASTNESVYDTTTVTYTPQSITNLRIENFKSGVVTAVDGGEVEYVSNETHSSIIVPGKNGLIKIFVEPEYASVDMIEISSSEILVNGIPYKVRFQQMLYNTDKGFYVSYPGYTTENTTLKLQKNSLIDASGNKTYNGIIYVRTVLEKLIGVSQTFEITVKTHTYVRDEEGNYDKHNPVIDEARTRTTTKLLQTDYNPGVSLEVANLIKQQAEINSVNKEVYLIEKSSDNTVIYARIYGYHINQQPIINVDWVNSYSDSVYNYLNYAIGSAVKESDGSYIVPVYITTKNLPAPVKFSMSLSLISEGTINKSEEKVVELYPVDFIPTGLYLKDSGNDYATLDINSSMYFDFVWQSAGQQLNSNAINAMLFNQDENNGSESLDFIYAETYNAAGFIERKYLDIAEYSTFKISADNNAKRYVITALGEDAISLTFLVRYNFVYNSDSGKFEIKFYTDRNSSEGKDTYTLKNSFTIRFRVATTEETADPIWTADQFRTKIKAGGNYILMNDITLTDWAPMEATFASLDGNGKVITIANFMVPASETVNAGLFSVVSTNTILKNVVVDISSCESIIMLADASITGDTAFGFIAGINKGIIYNSEVISLTNSNREITIRTSSASSYVGLFVGQNEGIITNSRVGTPYFERVTVDENGSTTSQVVNTSVFTIKSSGIVAGFAAQNSGTISSSYFNNANVKNSHIVGNDDVNMTAGFVANNTSTGSIYSSYAKGDGVSADSIRGISSGVYNTGAGSASGFVFTNSGLIENCYSNLYVESSSFGVAGFVYENVAGGVIKQSYSASEVTSHYENGSTAVSLAVELPFVGVDISNNLQSYGVLENCYYLEMESDTYDTSYIFSADMDMPIALNKESFSVSDSLINFAFIDGNYNQNIQGIWTYHATLDDKDEDTYKLGKTSLPELTSANQIVRSVRYVVEKVADDGEIEHVLMYANGYNQGTAKNPYIIRDYEEYNKVFSYNKDDVRFNGFTGNARLINNINFVLENNESVTINTTLGFTLGDKNNQTLTVFDGNGMTIEGVNIKNNEENLQSSLGLFNEIKYSIIKNIKLDFDEMDYTSTKAIYSGGLAGTIKDSYIIGLELNGNNTNISASNFAGGLAGIVTGNSGIYNVTSNLSVKVAKEGKTKYYQYISRDKFEKVYSSLGYSFAATDINSRYLEYLSQLSYAGGLVGVMDCNTNGEYSSVYNINKVTIGYDSNVSVVADISGFVAGYLGRGVSANRVKAVINNNSYVEGAYIVGGFAGENYGRISYSQVAYADNSGYDNTFKTYILNTNLEPITNSGFAYGTLNFVRSNSSVENYKTVAGGFIGVNYGGFVDNSYTKANITANANYVGGFIGVNFNGVLNTVYAQNYIDLSTLKNVENSYDRTENVGGLIAVNKKAGTDYLSKVYKLNNFNNITDNLQADSLVVATFFDKTHLVTHFENCIDELSLSENERLAEKVTIDYLIAETDDKIESGIASEACYVYYLNYGLETTSILPEGGINLKPGATVPNEFVSEFNNYIYYSDYISSNYNINKNEFSDLDGETQNETLNTLHTYGTIWNKLLSVTDGTKFDYVAYDIRNLYDLTYSKQEEVFTKLFLSFDMTMWDKDNTKYFPTLKENPTLNFYEINNEADLLLMVLHPDANFILNGDIELSSERVNYVLDIEFTGLLIGRTDENNNNPTIKGIKLYSDGTTDTAGFFRQTGKEDGANGAVIMNVNFEYDYLVADNSKGADTNIETVGLLTPEDYAGEFSGVVVSVKSSTDDIRYNSIRIRKADVEECRIVTNPNKTATVTTFGGLIGEANGSNIISCSSFVNLYLVGTGDATANVGGIIGKSTEKNDNNTMIMSANFTGTFNLTEVDNVGGIVGHANSTSIDGGETNLTISIATSTNANVGGVIGYQQRSFVEDTFSKLNIECDNNSRIQNAAHYYGGVSGFVNNEGLEVGNSNKLGDAGVIGVMAVVNAEIFENIGIVAVGGVYGSATGGAKIQDSVSWCYGTVSGADSVYFGGLIAFVNAAELIAIDNSLAYMEGVSDASGISLNASNNIVAGGLIGSIETNSEIVVEITNSSSSGAIWPEYESVAASEINFKAGGLIGSWTQGSDGTEVVNLSHYIEDTTLSVPEVVSAELPGTGTGGVGSEPVVLYSTKIVNTYTTLMIETSNSYHISSNSFKVAAFIGYIKEGTTTTIKSSNLYYSSDFTLCLEEKGIFENAPIDLLSQSILLGNQKSKFFTDGWETVGGGLPYRTSLTTKLSKISVEASNIYSRYTSEGIYSLNPKRFKNIVEVKSSGIEYKFNEKYGYYFVDVLDTFAVSDQFTGVILGGGNEVFYERQNVKDTLDIEKHSVLSNLKITIKEEEIKDIIEKNTTEKEFSFVRVNNGTLFNIYIDYFYKPTSSSINITKGGGLVATNKGTMSYCFNSGNIEEVISAGSAGFAGIATENSGYIEHSGFVGTLTGSGSMAGFCYKNTGTIYNSYSAGVVEQANTFVKTNNGKIENCFYDKFANMENVEIKDASTGKMYLSPVETLSLQSGGAGLVGNWTSYTMKSGVKTVVDEVSGASEVVPVYTTSYNYGYPIYQLVQYYYDDIKKSNNGFEFKGLATGDGSSSDPYLFNNLGTLNQINVLGIDSQNRSFMLVNDVDGKKNGLATGNNPIMRWEGINSFAGEFTTGVRGLQGSVIIGEEDTNINTVRIIDNLIGASGLFKKVNAGASISMVAFGGANIYSSSGNVGLLANEVQIDEGYSYNTPTPDNSTTDEYDAVEVMPNDVNIAGIFMNASNSASDLDLSGYSVGGLIGKVYGDGVLLLEYVNTYSISGIELDIRGLTGSHSAKFNLYSSNTSENLGGFIGETYGSVTVYVDKVQFSMNSSIGFKSDGNSIEYHNSSNVGGVIGNVGAGSFVNINSLSIGDGSGNISGNQNVGGVIGVNAGTSVLTLKESQELNVSLGIVIEQNYKSDTVGGLVGSMSEGKFTLNTHSSAKITIKQVYAKNDAGGLIGLLNGGEFEIVKSADVTVSSVKASVNAGGLAGSMSVATTGAKTPPKFKFAKASEVKVLELISSRNAGGIVGTITGGSLLSVDSTATSIIIEKLKSDENGGGATGYLGEGETGSIGTVAGFDIMFQGSNYDCKNFGGVAGQADAGQFGTYEGEFGVEEELAVNVEGDVTLETSQCAGGVIGLINPKRAEASEFVLCNITSKLNITVMKKSATGGLGGLVGVITKTGTAESIWIEFGKVKLENNTIDGQLDFENVGGLFGQLSDAKFTTFKDSEISVSGLKISGTKNVGGFAGSYNSENTIEVNDKFADFLKGTSVGTISISTVENVANINLSDLKNASNFGGLFGLYQAPELGYYVIDSEDKGASAGTAGSTPDGATAGSTSKKLNAFKNTNELFDITEFGKYEVYTIAGAENSAAPASTAGADRVTRTISNIGGIAGQFITNSENAEIAGNNTATIGSSYEGSSEVATASATSTNEGARYSDLTDKELQSLDHKKKELNISSVGGLVGNVKYNAGGTTDEVLVAIKNAINSGTVKGYQGVGGLVGSVTNTGLRVVSASVSGAVYGYQYIGGVIGRINTLLDWGVASSSEPTPTPEPTTMLTSTEPGTPEPEPMDGVTLSELKVSGYGYLGSVAGEVIGTEVGGLIGKLTATNVDINGLINIGGLVGSLLSNRNQAFKIMGNGEYDFRIRGNTNIGGVVGYVGVGTSYQQSTDATAEISNFDNFEVDITLIDYKIGPDTSSDSTSGDDDVYYKPTSVGGIVGYGQLAKLGSTPTGNINTEDASSTQSLSGTNNYLVGSGSASYKTGTWDDDAASGEEYSNDDINNDFRSFDSTITGIGGLLGTGHVTNFKDAASLVNIYAPNGCNVGGVAGYLTLIDGKLDLDDFDSDKTGKVYIAGGMGVGALFGGLQSNVDIVFNQDETGSDPNADNRLTRAYETVLQQTESGDPVYGMYVGGGIGKSSSIVNVMFGDKANITIDNTDGYGFGGLIGWLAGNLTGGDSQTGVRFAHVDNYNYGGLVGCVNISNKDNISVLGRHTYAFTVDVINTNYSTDQNSAYKAEQGLEEDNVNGMLYLLNHLTYSNETVISSSAYVTTFNPIRDAKGLDGIGVKTSGWAKEYTMFRRINYVYEKRGQVVSKQTIYDAEFVVEVRHENGDTSKEIEYTIYDNGNGPVLYTKYGIAEYLDYYLPTVTMDPTMTDNQYREAIEDNYIESKKGILKKILNNLLWNCTATELIDSDFNPIYYVRTRNIQTIDGVDENFYAKIDGGGVNISSDTFNQFRYFTGANVIGSLLDSEGSVEGAYDWLEDNHIDDHGGIKNILSFYLFETEKYGLFRFSTPFVEFGDEYTDPGTPRQGTSGSIFDVLGAIANRMPTEVREIDKFLWFIDSWDKDNLYKLQGLSSKLGENYEDTIRYYINNYYEGSYGFISDILYRDSAVNMPVSDKSVKLLTKYNRGGVEYEETMLYYYYSSTEPEDFDTATEIISKEKAIAAPVYTDYIPQEDDEIPMFKRVGDEYYIVSYGLDLGERSVQFESDLKAGDEKKPYIYYQDEEWYVAYEDEGISESQYTDIIGVNKDYINPYDTIDAILGFEYDEKYHPDPLTEIEGYDYVYQDVGNVLWILKDSNYGYETSIPMSQESSGGYLGSYYEFEETATPTSKHLVPISYKYLNGTENIVEYMDYGDKFLSLGGYDFSSNKVYTTSCIKEIYRSIYNKELTIEGKLYYKYVTDYREVNGYTPPIQLGYHPILAANTVKYGKYNNMQGTWYDESAMTDDGDIAPVYEILDQEMEIDLYTKSGTEFIRQTVKLEDIAVNNNYYYGPSDAKKFINIYKFEDNNWMVKRFGYYVKRFDREYTDKDTGETIIKTEYELKQAKPDTSISGSNYVENRYNLTINGDKLYLRYHYNSDVVNKLKSYINSTKGKLYKDGVSYKLAEIVMVTFNSGSGSGFICDDSNAGGHSITYDLKGGAFDTAPVEIYIEGGSIRVENPTKAGYKFVGWYSDSALNNLIPEQNVYSEYTTINFVAAKYNDDVKLYAKWIKAYEITYNLDGGAFETGVTITTEFTEGSDEEIIIYYPEKAGATFDDWYTDQGLTKTLDSTSGITIIENTIDYIKIKLGGYNNDLTLYAKWS